MKKLFTLVVAAALATVCGAACEHANVHAVDAKEPTCTDWGWWACNECDDCGAHIQTSGDYSPMRPPLHKYFDAGVETVPGVKTYTCSACHAELTSNVSGAKKIPLKSGDKIIFFGDSITAFGGQKDTGYCNRTIEVLGQLGVTVEKAVAGVVGDTSSDALARLQRDESKILVKQATGETYFTYLIGVNDVSPYHAGHPTAEQYMANVDATLNMVVEAGIKPVVIIFPGTVDDYPTGQNSQKANFSEQVPLVVALRNYAAEKGYPIVEAFDPIHEVTQKLGSGSTSGDGIHMSELGDALLAKCIIEATTLEPKAILPVATQEALPYTKSKQTGVLPYPWSDLSGDMFKKDVGTYTVTATLADGAAWADGETATRRDITWKIGAVKTANEWTTLASITKSTWALEEDPGVITAPVAKFGAATMVPTLNGAAWDGTTLPTEAGSYIVTWTVPESDDYLGLTTSLSFTITGAPETYTFYDWIDSSATRTSASAGPALVIDGFALQGDYKIETKVNLYAYDTSLQMDYYTIFCARTEATSGTTPKAAQALFALNTQWRYDYYQAGTADTAHLVSSGSDLEIVANGNVLTVNGTRIASPDALTTKSSGAPLMLFGANNSKTMGSTPASNFAKMRMYSFTVKSADGTTLLDLVPAKRDSDQVAGMYDCKSGNFYASATAQAFVVGNSEGGDEPDPPEKPTPVISGSITMAGWTEGETASEPTGLTSDRGTIVYKYYSNEGCTAALGSKPTTANTYWVRGEIAATADWNAAVSAAVSFTIAKKQGGDDPKPPVTDSGFLARLRGDPRVIDGGASPHATGGDIILEMGDGYVHVFTNSAVAAEFTAKSDLTAQILVVGGAGGGANRGGGGGAGGFVASNDLALAQGTYAVTVGAGGAGGAARYAQGSDGGDSFVKSGETDVARAAGGGGGGSQGYDSSTMDRNYGRAGGSGGGSAKASATGGAGIAGQGHDGGVSALPANKPSAECKHGGGGGAGAAGGNGAGGNGLPSDILGFEQPQYFAGGGAGGGESGAGGSSGGLGGGAASTGYQSEGVAGEDGLGGGGSGGGGNSNGKFLNGGRGGSGIVIIRYEAVPCEHNWQKTGDIQKLDCIHDGIESFKCTICEATKTVTTPALGHDYQFKDTDYFCTRCKKMKPCESCTWGAAVPDPAATCLTEGTNAFTCTRCLDTKREVVPPLGHALSVVCTTNSLPTCTTPGEYTQTCTREGCGLVVATPIPALDHIWGDWKTAVEPKCTTDGKEKRTCSREVAFIDGHTEVCGATEERAIPAPGHHFVDYRCTVCGLVEDASELVADIRSLLSMMKNVREVAESPYATGGDLILQFADNEYLHVFSDPREAKAFTVGADFDLLGQTLVVGGGGGAGVSRRDGWNVMAGGGGAGGGVSEAEDVWFRKGEGYAVAVGAGGAAGKYQTTNKVTFLTRAADGGGSSVSGAGVEFSVLGGGAGGSGALSVPLSADQDGSGTGANGGGASGCCPDYVVSNRVAFGTLAFGNPGAPAGGQAGGASATEAAPGAFGNIWGGGGAGAGGPGATGARVKSPNPGEPGVVSGGAGVAVGIFGTEIRLAGGGAGGVISANGNSHYSCLGQDGGGSNTQNPYGDAAVVCTATAGRSGYGGGGAVGWATGGGQGASMPGGSGLVAIRYRMIGTGPAEPLVTFAKCAPVEKSETSVRFDFKVRGFGEGAEGARVVARWGLIPYGETEVQDWQETELAASSVPGEDASATLGDLAPGRFYTFRLFAENEWGRVGWGETEFTFQMPGGRTILGSAAGVQREDARHVVDFSVPVTYVGENTTTVTFRWRQSGDADWSEETTTFTRDNAPTTVKFTKTFLSYKPVDFEFVSENESEDEPYMKWTQTVAGRAGLTDGKITEAYWAGKTLNFTPRLEAGMTKVQSGREVNYYSHDLDPAWGDTGKGGKNWNGRDIFKLYLPTDGDHTDRPLVVGLHGRGGDYETNLSGNNVYNAPDDAYFVAFDNNRTEGSNVNHSFAFWWGATQYFRGPEQPGISDYRDETSTAKRVLDCIEWIVREKGINRNRIYLCGNSMGGQGALAIGLPHGEVFACIEANVPATIWYPCARMNLIDDLGYVRKPGDRDGTVYNDPPPVMDWSGSNDVWSRNHEILLEAMNTFRYSYLAMWGDYGHCNPYSTAQQKNDMVGKWNWRWIEKNKAYPVFSNVAEGNQVPPWPWATVNYGINSWTGADPDNKEPLNDIKQIGAGTTVTYSPDATMAGQRNAFLRWENVSDDASGVSLNLWIATAEEAGTKMFTPPASTKADVTLRRIQGFTLIPGQKCSWTFGSERGEAVADAEGLVTANVTLTGAKTTFTLVPGEIEALVATAEILEKTETSISVVVDVTSLGKGASSAAIRVEHQEVGAATWVAEDYAVTAAGATAYEITGLAPGKAYNVRVTLDNGAETKAFAFDGVRTVCHPLVATAALGSVTENAINVDVTVEQIGTFATAATVTAEIRSSQDRGWETRTLAEVTEPSSRRCTIDGLKPGMRYALVLRIANDCADDRDLVWDFGTVETAYAGDKRRVDPPFVRDLVFNGHWQAPAVDDTEDYWVTINDGGKDVGEYELRLTLRSPDETRWEGSEDVDYILTYRIASKIDGLKVPKNTEVYTSQGDVYMIFHKSTEGEFALDYDGRADVLLIGGGGPGGMAGDYITVRPGAGGGAGGFVEQSGVALVGGMPYTVTVGKGGEPGTNHDAINNKGGDTSLVGGDLSIVAYGGGGGGHASSGAEQKSAAMGRKGASSGGCVHYAATWQADDFAGDGSNSIDTDRWRAYFVAGQGHQGGRVGGSVKSWSGEMWCISACGGGAGAAGQNIDQKVVGTRYFEPGAEGRVSSLTGVTTLYAGGGSGGVWAETGAAAGVTGGVGGGGAAWVTEDGEIVSTNGADGLGGGGAGASCQGTTLGKPGRGGDGVVVICLRGYAGSACAHENADTLIDAVEPTCETPGRTAKVVCEDCGKLLSSSAEIAPLGHDFSNRSADGTYCARPGCGVESRFSKINKLIRSRDGRHVFLNVHRGVTSPDSRIPENSAEAIRDAIAKGGEIIEIDPKATADGVIVLAHDADMKRQVYGVTPSGKVGSGANMNWYGEVEDFTLRVSDAINEDSGCRVCTLEEALKVAKDQCFLQLDCNFWTIGDNRTGDLWNLIKKYGMEDQCIMYRNNFEGEGKSHPADMRFVWDEITATSGRKTQGVLNQNQPIPYNDGSAGSHPDRLGWQSALDYYNATSLMSDDMVSLKAYLESVGRRNPDWRIVAADDTRRVVKVPYVGIRNFVAGRTPKFGVTETADYEVVEDEGNGDPENNQYYFILKLKDPENTRWSNVNYTDSESDARGVKKVWYLAEPLPAETVPALPTDYADMTPGVTTYEPEDSVPGLKWTGATRAYAIQDEVVLIFGAGSAAGGFEVADGYEPIGRYLLVGGGGPGGMNGTKGGNLPGAGGGAGGMLEGEFNGTNSYLNPGSYAVSVGKGGTPGTSHTAANNRGANTTLTSLALSKELLTAFGGGGGGHAVTGDDQDLAARGVAGGSSGGSLIYYSYGNSPSMPINDWIPSAVEGQGNPGGRIGGYLQSSFGVCNASVGGGGASLTLLEPPRTQTWTDAEGASRTNFFTLGFGEKFDIANTEEGKAAVMNKFTGGGQGRMSDITGSEVYYAGGGAGGAVYSPEQRGPVLGGLGGGGSVVWTAMQVSGHGVAMLGGGGAGMGYRTSSTFTAGNGGDGVAIFRLKMEVATCPHSSTNVTKEAKAPTCEEAGWTATSFCADCGRQLEESVDLPALGHDDKEIGRQDPTVTEPGWILYECQREGCGRRRTEEIPIPTPSGNDRPTDMPEGATAIASGAIDGIAWTGAAASWKLDNGNAVIVFTNVANAGSFTVNAGKTATVDYLAVGGGGAGGSGHKVYAGAGGGAGGVVSDTGCTLAGGVTYTVTVGKGGKADATQTGGDWLRGENGGNSSLTNVAGVVFEALGGGAGGTGGGNPANGNGASGGCGGGTCYIVDHGPGTPGSGEEGQGCAGGGFPASTPQVGVNHRPKYAGGGGGAGSPGEDARVSDEWLAGNGGAAVFSVITGKAVWYAGGGAGGAYGYADETKEAAGGIGGGSTKVKSWVAESGSGVDSLGGGGGGAAISDANIATPGNGGNGVVVIRVTKVTDGGVIPVGPGGKSKPYDTKEAAEADLANGKVVFEPSDDVKKVFAEDPDGLETYKAKFDLKVVPEDDKWVIVAELTSGAQEELLASADEATRQIPLAEIAALQEGDDPVAATVTDCVPGFYYSLYDGSEVAAIEVDPDNRNVLCGTNGTVTFPEVKKPSAEKGFFFVGAGEAPME